MQYKSVVFCVLLFSLVSCTKNKSVKKLLTNDDIKYWYVVADYPIRSTNGVCFRADGTYSKYVRNNVFDKSMLPTKYDNRTLIDDLEKPVWKIINDTTFMYGEGLKFRIIYNDENVFILGSLEIRSTLILLRDTDQTTKPVRDIESKSFPTL